LPIIRHAWRPSLWRHATAKSSDLALRAAFLSRALDISAAAGCRRQLIAARFRDAFSAAAKLCGIHGRAAFMPSLRGGSAISSCSVVCVRLERDIP